MPEQIILVLMLVMGLLTHFAKKLMEASKEKGRQISVARYWTSNKWASSFSLLSSVSIFLVMWGSPDLDRSTAWGIGFICNSIADVFGSRTLTVIGGQAEERA